MSIGRDSLAYWFSQVAGFALSFVTSVFVAVILGPEQRGLFVAVVLANTLCVNLSNLGLQALSMYFIGKNPEQLSRFHTLIVILTAAISIVVLAAFGLWGEALRRSFFDTIGWRYLAVALAALPFSLYYFAAQGVLTGFGRVWNLSRFLFYYSAATNAASLAVLGLLPWKVEGLLAVWMMSQVVAAAVMFAMVRRSPCRWVRLSIRETIEGLGLLLSYGLKAFVGNFAGSLINRVDHVFILATSGPLGLGIYGLAAKLAELIYQPSAALEKAGFQPVATSERRAAARLVQDLFRVNFILNGTITLLMVIASRPFILLFYREEYAGVVLPFRIILPGALLLSCSRMLALFFSAQMGKPLIPSGIAWVTLAFNLPMMSWVVLHGNGGLAAAAWVTTGSYALMLTCYLLVFGAQTGLLNPLPYFVPQRRDLDRLATQIRDAIARKGI